jgi:hypothetical protein
MYETSFHFRYNSAVIQPHKKGVSMKKKLLIPLLGLALCSTFIIGCGGYYGTDSYLRFDSNLQGTWKTVSPDERYEGTLEITYDRITITGYGSSQTPMFSDDNQRPFKNFLKGIALKGYSEEGHIFIEDAGLVQEGIPYRYWSDSPNYNKIEFLRFEFGGKPETLRKSNE